MPSPRRNQIALLALAVLCGLLTWRASERIAQSPKRTLPQEEVVASESAPAAPTVPRVPGRLKWVAIEVLQPGQTPRLADAKFTNRFRNTDASLDELVRNDRALNLRNALVDTASGQPLELPAGLEAGAEPGAYLVQSHGMLNDRLRRDLKAAGLEVVTYMPNNAYLVTGSREAMERAADSAEVAAILPFAPAFKLEPELLAQVLTPGHGEAGQQVILTVPDPEQTLPDIVALGGQEVFRERGPFGTLLTVAAASDRLADFARLPGVLMVERWMPRELANDLAGPAMGSTTNLDNTGSYLELTGEGVLININDSGVDASHPDLVNRVSTISNLAATVLLDRDGHGTHVAGTIAGDGAASATIAGTPQGSTNTANFQGRAPKAKLFVLPVDLIQGPPSGDTFLQEEAARAPGRTNRNRPLISNNSWGYNTREYSSKSASYDAAVRDALPGESGSQPILYVFSAGNDGLGGNAGVGGIPDSIASPGNAKNAITVGALESPRNLTNAIVYDTNGIAVKIGSQEFPGRGFNPTNLTYFTNEVLKSFTDTGYQVAGYSSRGNVGVEIEGESGRFKPDVVAPGSFVLSARSAAWRIEEQYPADPFTGEFPDEYYLYGELERTNATAYRFESGTSMAAPAISGLLAQMQQYFEQRLNQTPSAATYKALLINSSLAPSETYEPDTKEAFNYAGWGQPVLPRALRSGLRIPGSDRQLGYFEGAGLATREAASFRIRLTSTNAPLRFTLVWTDPPGNPAASTKLVNDLDLIVSNTVSGEVFLGNDFASGSGFPRQMTTNGSSLADRVNNVERIVLQSPLGAEYQVFVVAHRVNVNARWDNPDQIAQDFSLAVSSDAPEGEFAGELTEPVAVDPVVLGLPAPTEPLVITNGVAMFNLKAGAHSPLIGDQRGTTNQWRFFVFTNIPGTTTNGEIIRTNGSNVAFVIFPSLPDSNLSRTRTNGPDLDLYVSRDPGLLTLEPAVLDGSLKSRSREATELVAITNSPIGSDIVYYVGVKSEDQQGGEFAFFGISTDQPFTVFDENGFPHPFTTQLAALDDGSPSAPSVGQWIAISLVNDELRRVNPLVTVSHDNFEDLFGQLQLRSTFAVLNNHGTLRDLLGGNLVSVLYDDSGSGDYADTSVSRPSDGPGSLNEFMGVSGGGPWFFSMVDNAVGNRGSINGLDLQLRPNDFGPQFVVRCVRAQRVELEVINIPADASSLTITITNRQGEQLAGPLEVYVRREALPDISNPANNDKFATIFPPNGGDLVISLRDVPPLTAGRYFIAVYNPNNFEICYRIRGRIERGQDGNLTKVFESATINQSITDLGLSYSGVVVDDARPVTAIGAGLRFEHPRLSDLSIRLINPAGDSTVLVENRGRTEATAFGRELITTNGEFAHVAMTFERSSGRAQIYVNGLRVAEQNIVGVVPDTTNSLHFGTDGVRANGSPITLDDFGLWSRVLTADNIRDIYRYGVEDSRGKDVTDSEAGLVGFWPFNGNGAEAVAGAAAALSGHSAVAGQLGQAVQLGTGTVPAPARGQALDVIRHAGFTLEGWVKADTNAPSIIAGWAGTNGNVGPLLLANYPAPLGGGPGSFSVVFTNVAAAEAGATGLSVGTGGGLVTPGATVTNTLFAVLTELTNANSEFIKFAVPPFVTDTRRRVLASSTFDIPRVGDQFYDVGEVADGWTVVSNIIQWDFFPEDALTGNSCIELFPNLGGGTGSRIRRTFTTTPGRSYTLSTGYRRVPSSSGPSSTVEVFADGVLISSFAGLDNWQTNAALVQATGSSLTFDIANSAGGASTTAVARAVAVVESGQIARVNVVDGGAGYVSPPIVRFQTIGFPAGGRSATAVATVENGVVTQIRVVNPGTNYSSANPPRVVIAPPPVAPKPAETFLDEIRFVEEPTGLYVPEEPLRPLAKGSALGQWRLEVTDSRAGEVGDLLEWQMQLTFAPTNPPAHRLTSGVPFTTNLVGDGVTYFIVEVPPEVYATTNTLVSVTGGPLNLLYSQSGLPDGLQAEDYLLLSGVLDTPQSSLLLTNVLPQLQPGQRYYLGVQNPVPGLATTFTVQVDFGLPLTALTNNVPFQGTNPNRGLIDYYSFNVTPDALGVRFSVSNLNGDVNLVVRRAPDFPTRTVFDYASTNLGTLPESVQIDPFSAPVPLTPGLWYLGVYPSDPNPTNQLSYTILARELVGNTTPLTNGVPLAAAITNVGLIEYYFLDITDAVESVSFALTNLVGDVDLYVRKGLPLPTPSSFGYASANFGNADEQIVLQANRNTDLQSPGRWYLAVIPNGPVPVSYTVVAKSQEPDPNVRFLLDSVPDIASAAVGPTNLLYRFDVPPDSTTRIIFEIYGLTGDADLLVSKDLPPDQSPTVLSGIKPGLQNELVVAADDRFPQLGGEWYVQVRFPGALTNAVECTVRAATRQDGLLVSGAPIVMTYSDPTAAGQTPFIQWNAVPGELYQVQSTRDLSFSPLVWTPVISPAVVPGEQGLALIPFANPTFPTFYYRVIQLPNP